MQIDILSLFPGYFRSPFESSILKKAIDSGRININTIDIRSFSKDKHKRVDERPFGGGPGMVMMAEPVLDAVRSVKKEGSWTIYLSPQGKLLNAKKCEELAKKKHLVLLSGHYEGIDERIMKEVDEEISIGDFVLTNGCIAAILLVDGVVRFIPEVLGHVDAASMDSFQNGLLKGPQYTRPEEFEGERVPEVLLSGHHAKIEEWRLNMGLEKTKRVRPDLYEKYCLEKEIS